MSKVTYKDAGVDLDVYRESMSRLPRHLSRTFSPRVIPQPGGFAGLFRLDFANPLFARNYDDPVLVSCSDGVGTKLKVAQRVGRHNTVGIDLVAMSINDAICMGAEPLFFLDYVAMPRDNPELLEQIVSGISDGCVAADCALLGGETAIMPDLYTGEDYDLAGFCVGVAERERIIDGSAIKPGDVLVGIGSSGLHSNGFTLVRKIVFEVSDLCVDQQIAELGCTVGEALLEPTRIYVSAVKALLERFGRGIHGLAHVTGGGLQENVDRIIPAQLSAHIRPDCWDIPPVFNWLQTLGEVEDAEMARVFNMGIGLVVIIEAEMVDAAIEALGAAGHHGWPIGEVCS